MGGKGTEKMVIKRSMAVSEREEEGRQQYTWIKVKKYAIRGVGKVSWKDREAGKI